MKRIITYGTYDLFHYGHLRLLERAKNMGDYLIVAVSTDTFNAVKGKKCAYPYQQRAEIVKAIRYVDEVIPEECWEQKRDDIIRLKVDALVMGDDWEGKFDDLKDICEVIYLPRTSDISTTSIKLDVKNNH
ncbi:glycerol-3-phosphate cytidylyltransferase [bacterium]|nr:glycerol-3-phosphate cytidylyltransferase [bacterium]